MARTKVNKSAAIKEALTSHKGKKPREIAEILNKQGLKVTPMYVSNIKATMAKGKGTGKKTGKRGRPKGVTTTGAGIGTGRGSFGAVEEAIVFTKRVGGLKEAKQLIALLEEARGL